jgi:DNA-directed RNA polymerase subunit M/transcription elongation factor TFIIS
MDGRVKDQIEDVADEIASSLQARYTALGKEIAALEERAAELKAQADTLRHAPDRAAKMEVFVGGNYQCPWCWVEHGIHANLKPIASDDPRDNLFRCQRCRNTLRVSYL